MKPEELQHIQHTKWAGTKLVHYKETDSTNTQAKSLAEEGYPHGTVVMADRQRAGRGRSGRLWESSKEEGLCMTLLLRPEIAPNAASMLTLVAAMAVTKAIRRLTELPVQIKWPNDIVLHGKKICGILTEMSTETDHINYVVVGIGINVANESFPEEIRDTATSLFLESGKCLERMKLLEAICQEFESYYDLFCQTCDLTNIQGEYEDYLVNRDRQVRVLDPKEPFVGIAKGITKTGELIVATEDGEQSVSSGEVSVRGIYGYV